ncbi:MAG TPA: biotin/lipoyl-containing protein, partial [Streptosporangiaceae bacterium]|nr:biotin/lipoyl-containing protein [Streptosporangiaceae bacterium]
MSVSVSMPQLGESVTEGTVTRWLKHEGDHVSADEPLLEVSTDKVDTEIPSPVSGILRGITVAEDETVAVGAELAIIDEDGAPGAAPGAQQSAPAEAPPAAEPTQQAPPPAAPAPQHQEPSYQPAQAPYEQAPYEQAPYGQPQYEQAGYEQPPAQQYAQPQYEQPQYGQDPYSQPATGYE